MNRMTDEQRDEVARVLDHISTQSHENMNLDAALDAIAETVLPDAITRYFEAHITVEPAGFYEDFATSMQQEGSVWRASKFEHDDVDGIAGKWFASARDTSYSALEREVRRMVSNIGRLTPVLRYKIEETLLDTKCGDTL